MDLGLSNIQFVMNKILKVDLCLETPCFSPFVRWGLLDFMWVHLLLVFSSSPLLLLLSFSSSPPLTFSSSWSSFSLLNRDPALPVFPSGPRPWSCAASVPFRASTSRQDFSIDARTNARRYARKNVRRDGRNSVRKNVTRDGRQNVRRDVRKNARQNVRR